MIRVCIADDHDIIRQGLRRIISFEEDLVVACEAENGEKALEMLKRYESDVLLLDFNMPLLNGIEVLKIMKEQESSVKVIMLTVENDRRTLHEAIDIGADGYLLKDSAGTEIVNAIKTVFNGEKYIDKSLVSLLFSAIKNDNKRTVSILGSLSKREIEVLIEISKGFSNKEIGDKLYLSEKTVKNYATNLFRKLKVEDRLQAAILAININVVDYYKAKPK